jgi:hypothetical protein
VLLVTTGCLEGLNFVTPFSRDLDKTLCLLWHDMHRCLEGLFDTWGTFGHGFNGNLELGGPKPLGAQKANLSEQVAMYMQEVALNEQVGHR